MTLREQYTIYIREFRVHACMHACIRSAEKWMMEAKTEREKEKQKKKIQQRMKAKMYKLECVKSLFSSLSEFTREANKHSMECYKEWSTLNHTYNKVNSYRQHESLAPTKVVWNKTLQDKNLLTFYKTKYERIKNEILFFSFFFFFYSELFSL